MKAKYVHSLYNWRFVVVDWTRTSVPYACLKTWSSWKHRSLHDKIVLLTALAGAKDYIRPSISHSGLIAWKCTPVASITFTYFSFALWLCRLHLVGTCVYTHGYGCIELLSVAFDSELSIIVYIHPLSWTLTLEAISWYKMLNNRMLESGIAWKLSRLLLRVLAWWRRPHCKIDTRCGHRMCKKTGVADMLARVLANKWV